MSGDDHMVGFGICTSSDGRGAPASVRRRLWRVVGAGRLLALGLAAVLAVAGCAVLPQDVERPESYAPRDTADTSLGRIVAARRDDHPEAEAGFLPLGTSTDALVARAVLARFAERSIDAQYYLLHDDLTGRYFIYELLAAADRGVRVRLLLDDMAIPRRDPQAAAVSAHPNIDVRIFNPFSRNVPRVTQYITRFGSVTRRMHNKSFIVDNQLTILGGRNIGDEYFGAGPNMTYSDLDVIVIGDPVVEVSRSFDEYWNSDLSYPIESLVREVPSEADLRERRRVLTRFIEQNTDSAYAKALRDSALANAIRRRDVQYYWGDATVVVDEPGKIRTEREDRSTHLLPRLRPYFDDLTDELIIIAAYFVPGQRGTDYLTGLSQRGVRIRILTNSLSATDVTPVHAGYSRYRKRLLEAGVELHEMKPLPDAAQEETRGGGSGFAGSSRASLHAKSFVLDRSQVFIGSLNLDPRSADENTEIGVVMQNVTMATEMAEWFERNIDRIAYRVELCGRDDPCDGLRWYDNTAEGEQAVYDHDPETSFWRRLQVRLYRLLPFESQL